jgi:hypothetical protein
MSLIGINQSVIRHIAIRASVFRFFCHYLSVIRVSDIIPILIRIGFMRLSDIRLSDIRVSFIRLSDIMMYMLSLIMLFVNMEIVLGFVPLW